MTKIVISDFSGERPRLTETILPTSAAQVASNCNFISGSLNSFRKERSIYQLVLTGQHGTIYAYYESDGTQRWLEWAEDVDVQPGPIAGDSSNRAYFTGTDLPRVFDDTMVDSGAGSTYPKSSYRLGVQKPAVAAAAALGGGGAGVARDVRYVYTYVRKWASGAVDEGQPSDASNIVNALPGQTVNLSLFSTPVETDTGITHRWIYRVNTGTTGAEYQFVDEIAIGTVTYADTLTDADLGEAISSTDWREPPTDMKGLIALPNGCFAGFSGKQVVLSVPYQVHAYPNAYRYTLPFAVVNIGYIGTMIVAATEGPAFLLDGTDPQFQAQTKVPAIYPCLSKRGLVSTQDGVVYPTREGLAIVGPGGAAGLLTQALVSKEDWEEFFPETMLAVSHSRRYFAAFENTGDTAAITNDGFLIDHNEPESGIVGMSGGIHCLHVDASSGTLYYVKTDTDGRNYVYEWDALVERVPYLWRSKKFILPANTNFGAARILGKWDDALTQAEQDAYNAARDAIIAANQAALAADDSGSLNGAALNEEELNGDDFQDVPPELDDIVGMTFKLYADGVLMITRTVDSDNVFRLPSGYLARTVEIELQGQIEAQEVRIAPSITELADA